MMSGESYYVNEVYPNISNNPIVFTGDTAMVWNGFSVSGIFIPDVLTSHESLRDMRVNGIVNYHYVPKVDRENYVKPFLGNDMILLPTPERAIVENIKYDLDFIDEGYFCDSLERYQHSSEFNYELLKEVATFYGVPMDKVDYWLEESKDYNSW